MTNAKISVNEHFSILKDPRIERQKLYPLIEIVTITICAIICGAKTWTDIETFGKEKTDWLQKFLLIENGIPSHDTFGRVFSLIDPDEFRQCFSNWVASINHLVNKGVVAIDGKTVRHSYDKTNAKKAIHVVSAWADQNNIVLGQVKVNEKSNEITAIPELLSILEISGCLITIDAMGCQKKIAQKIIKKNADYVLAVKGNQESLHNSLKEHMDQIVQQEDTEYFKTEENGHGRKEIREHWFTNSIEWLEQRSQWHSLKSVGIIKSIREIGDKKSEEIRFYIMSISDSVKTFAHAVRAHWGIENKLHWVLDVAFREDESRIRMGNAPENFAVLRHMALNLLKNEKSLKKGIVGKQFKAALNNQYLEKILSVKIN